VDFVLGNAGWPKLCHLSPWQLKKNNLWLSPPETLSWAGQSATPTFHGQTAMSVIEKKTATLVIKKKERKCNGESVRPDAGQQACSLLPS
jgi:hypothetical protein